jgi:hypothetical protein
MSNLVKIADALGKDEENNGLDSLHSTFLADHDHIEVGLVWIRGREARESYKLGNTQVIVEILRFEPMGSPGAVPAEVVEAYLRAAKERTGGADPLPIDSVPES